MFRVRLFKKYLPQPVKRLDEPEAGDSRDDTPKGGGLNIGGVEARAWADKLEETRSWHVVLPAEVAKLLPKNRLLSEVSYPYMYRHNAMISEVLVTLKEPNGSNSGAIAKHIEVKCKLMKKANDLEVTEEVKDQIFLIIVGGSQNYGLEEDGEEVEEVISDVSRASRIRGLWLESGLQLVISSKFWYSIGAENCFGRKFPQISSRMLAKHRQAPNGLHDCGDFFFTYIHKGADGLVFSGVDWERFTKAHILDESKCELSFGDFVPRMRHMHSSIYQPEKYAVSTFKRRDFVMVMLSGCEDD
ncbi:hypothetical protein BUALT_Bualt12G0083600 [Buddleja alternifolia]|uniref:Uncharacterized protein n=1 Tax=Buddleja alternifolia TaxID=168488 RepID=A0AAV6WWW7_9LAMI|nr:hypothetical protein BUALT_Bualt12G0083600 [Buddleja alternifolia]